MTVKELEEELSKVENKNLPVLDFEYDEITVVVENEKKGRVVFL